MCLSAVFAVGRLSPVTTSKVVFADDTKMREYIHPDMLPETAVV